MATSSTEHGAADRQTGMTLQELQQFVDHCYRLDMPVTTPVKARVGWKGQLTVLTGTTAGTNQQIDGDPS